MTKGREPWWRPDIFARRRPYLEKRAAIVAAVRAFFAEQGFVEVETPALQVSPGLEPHLKAFATELAEPFGEAKSRRLYLHTSPEFAMKKLLVAGVPRMFQLARVYRNEQRSETHHPEFTMLEWYRAGEGYQTLMADCEGLLKTVARAAGTGALRWRGVACDANAAARRLSVAEAFRQYCNLDVLALAGNVSAFALEAERLGVATQAHDTWEDVFFRIFLARVEPHLGVGAPAILYEYPVALAALARPKPSDGRVAERFELYVAGLELANAFGELTDAGEQRRRFARDNDRRQRLYGERYPVDEDFLAALEAGLPASAGIALGFDRLVILATGAATIDDVLWAPVVEG
jgi:lysyl-tRNA synthetase class 2